MKDKKEIFVTQPFLPPLEEFIPYLESIWESKKLTNKGPYHNEFEHELEKYLGLNKVALFSNGTIALVSSLQALRVKGEVITTPYSFVATTHSLTWNGIKPIFVDIDPATCNIDPDKIEQAITPQTEAILAVHCYGNPCDVEKIQKIADIYGLKVIYDAAHAFGVKYRGESLLKHGDFSILSFHATKVFNTFEGGALVCPDAKTKQRVDFLKNFGYADEVTVVGAGINGKMSEFNAALGLLQLKYMSHITERRRELTEYYRSQLDGIDGVKIWPENAEVESNYAYFPVRIGSEYSISRDQLYELFKKSNIFTRRYFYPLISDFPMYRGYASASEKNLPQAKSLSSEILCLPLYPELDREDQEKIISVIKNPMN